MNSPEILVSAAAWRDFADLLAPLGKELRWRLLDIDGTIRTTTGERASSAHVDIAWLSTDVFFTMMPEFSAAVRGRTSLRWLQSAAAGTDAMLIRELHERGVRITTSHVTGIPIAEFVIGSVLRHYQQPERWTSQRAQRHWRHTDFKEISGTTWVVVGLGAIGSAVAQRIRPFGVQVIGIRRTPQGDEPVDEIVPLPSLPEVAGRADVLVLAVPATRDTHHLVDASVLDGMRPGSVLVNVARGQLVDERALLRALDSGAPEQAILDTTTEEPPAPDSPLWTHSRITLTPHTAGGGAGTPRRAASAFAENLARYLIGEPLRHMVSEPPEPAETGWPMEAPDHDRTDEDGWKHS